MSSYYEEHQRQAAGKPPPPTAGQFASFIGAILFIPVLLVLSVCSISLVPAGHNGVGRLFGAVQQETYPEGFNIHNPLVRVLDFDLRNQALELEAVEVPARDRLKATMDITVVFRLIGSQTPAIYRNSGDLDRLSETIIVPRVRSVLREAGKTIDRSQDFFLDSVQVVLQDFVLENTRDYLHPFGVEVVSVQFRDIDLPAVVKKAIQSVKERQEQVERERAELQRITLKEKQRIAIADAQLEASRKEAEARLIRARAEAEANILVNDSLSPALIHYEQWTKRWDGVLPKVSGVSDATLLLPTPPVFEECRRDETGECERILWHHKTPETAQ